MELQFGIWDHFERHPTIPVARQYDERIALVQRAEELGFYGYHVAEHHNTPLDLAPSPTVYLSALAQRTSRIKLGTLVFILPDYHPVRLVQELCMLDQLSKGRFVPGFGRGARDVEHEWFGVDPMDVRTRFAETLAVVESGLNTGTLNFHGKYYDFDSVPMDIRPYDDSGLALFYAGTPKTAAEMGMNVVAAARTLGPAGMGSLTHEYFDVIEQRRLSGLPVYTKAGEPLVGTTRHLFVADTDEEAFETASRAWRQYARNFTTTSLRIEGKPGPAMIPTGDDIQRYIDRGAIVTGSPESARDILLAQLKADGPRVNYFVTALHWGDLTHEEATRSMELYAAEVMPALRELQGAPA
jgi:alkanesulfonate monooxygenase SsuD/methylene tetrahydromethanopterin reductase-like flavin-dependent oxidoreductase (luciferase family)